MKKIICTLVALVGITASAQVREKGTIELTPKIGYSFSNYYTSQSLSNKPLGGFNAGVDFDAYFNNRWSFKSGLLYQRMGSRYQIINIEYKDKINYLTIPVNVNWHFGSTRKWNLNFGPSFGFVTGAKLEVQGSNIDAKSSFNSFQLGFNYGIGYKIEATEKFSILIDYQNMTGLTESLIDVNYNIKNRYGIFNLGGVIKL